MKRNIILIAVIAVILFLGGLSIYQTLTSKHHIATIELEDGRKIVVELYQDVAPDTVKNFVKLAEKGFYNGLTFHRVNSGAFIEGGDPNGDGTGGSDKTITGEFYNNNKFSNYLSHKEGTISMARSEEYDSASSQFFITCADCSATFDGKYAAFGRVLEGLDIVEELSNLELETQTVTNEEGTEESVATEKPVNPPVIKTITIEKYAKEYEITNQYDKDEMLEFFETGDSGMTLEEFYNNLENSGYIINEDGTITSPEGETTSLFTVEEDGEIDASEVIVE